MPASQCQGANVNWFITKCVKGVGLLCAICWSISITSYASYHETIILSSTANKRSRWNKRYVPLLNFRGGGDVFTESDDIEPNQMQEANVKSSSPSNSLKRGTRITGAGASKRRNPSIFSSPSKSKIASNSKSSYYQWTTAALAGDVLNRHQQLTKSSKTKEVEHSNNNPMSGRIWAKQTDDGLIIKIPVSRDGEEPVALIKLSASPYATVGGNEVDSDMIIPKIQATIIDEPDVIGNGMSSSSSPQSHHFRPLEGIYGIFNLPCSGPHVVLITESEEVYTAPRMHEESSSAVPILQLRRIKSLEIVPLKGNIIKRALNETTSKSIDDDDDVVPNQRIIPTNLQLAEEARQLKLLRNSFKEHDFYFSVANKEGVVRDISHCLQRSFLEWMGQKSKKCNETAKACHRWWLPYVTGGKTSAESKQRVVDPRFFWNEQAVMSLLYPLTGKNDDEEAAILSPYGLLLDQVVPVTSAFVGIQRGIQIPSSNISTSVNEMYDQLLISRRSKYRTGTRFTRRGVDGSGAVANYAETEQICLVFHGDKDRKERKLVEVYSHVQTRGSIPLHWSSPADIKAYRPRVYIGVDPLVQARGLRDHLLGELWWYSSSATKRSNEDEKIATRRRLLSKASATSSDEDTKIAMVNLIDKHGDQGRLGKAFDAVLSAVLEIYCASNLSHIGKLTKQISSEPAIGSYSVKHIWYDFHAECKGGRWEKLSSLLDQVAPILNGQGYFSAVPKSPESSSDWELKSVQDGVVRTNCMDCLDRTNVVQSIFGRYILYRQLQERKGKRFTRRTLPLECIVKYKNQPLTLPWLEGEMAHRFLWADNADAISKLYAGTPALKRDFTRTGKRTKRGAMNDGVYSLQRYYLNNFIDADRQEGMDLLVGSTQFNIIPSEGYDDSSRTHLLQELSNRRIKRKNNDEDDVGEQGDNTPELALNWLPGDLRFHMKNEAQWSRLPLSLAAEEEHVDAERSSDFLMAITSSAGGIDEMMNNHAIQTLQSIDQRSSSLRPWWAKTESKMIFSVRNIVPALKGKKAFVVAAFFFCKAPILSAAVIVSLISCSFPDDGD